MPDRYSGNDDNPYIDPRDRTPSRHPDVPPPAQSPGIGSPLWVLGRWPGLPKADDASHPERRQGDEIPSSPPAVRSGGRRLPKPLVAFLIALLVLASMVALTIQPGSPGASPAIEKSAPPPP